MEVTAVVPVHSVTVHRVQSPVRFAGGLRREIALPLRVCLRGGYFIRLTFSPFPSGPGRLTGSLMGLAGLAPRLFPPVAGRRLIAVVVSRGRRFASCDSVAA